AHPSTDDAVARGPADAPADKPAAPGAEAAPAAAPKSGRKKAILLGVGVLGSNDTGSLVARSGHQGLLKLGMRSTPATGILRHSSSITLTERFGQDILSHGNGRFSCWERRRCILFGRLN
ncbi:MAG: hypothetical protein ABWY64_25720, partial [Tardiphaga sp.]